MSIMNTEKTNAEGESWHKKGKKNATKKETWDACCL